MDRRRAIGAVLAVCDLVLVACVGSRRNALPDASATDSGRVSDETSTQGASRDQMRQAHQATFGTDLATTIRGPNTVAVGDTLEIGVTVANRGPGTAQQVEAAVELPAPLAFRSSSANCQDYRPPGGIRCTLLPISAGRAFDFTLRADVAGTAGQSALAVRASASSGPAGVVDPAPGNNAAAHRIAITPSQGP